jgi:hypothetical protein
MVLLCHRLANVDNEDGGLFVRHVCESNCRKDGRARIEEAMLMALVAFAFSGCNNERQVS